MYSRTNTAPVLTRAINSIVKPLGVTVKSSDRFRQASITGEIEQLMSAREFLSRDPRFDVTDIKIYSAMPATLYVSFK